MPRLLLERGISLNLRVSGRRGKVKAKNGVIGICRAGLETLSLMEVLLTTCKTCDLSPGRLPLRTYLRDPQWLPKESNKISP